MQSDGVRNGKLVVHLCLYVVQATNHIFLQVATCIQTLLLPQWTRYDRRVFFVFVAQFVGSDVFTLTLAKCLQVYYANENFLLLFSLSSLVPFLRAMHNLWTFIPCLPMAALISNLALIFSFILLVVLGLGTYSGSVWIIYAFVMTVWPWLVLMSMISRLYIERNLGKNPFSPIRELPILGLVSAFAQVLSLMAAKKLAVSDCIVLSMVDPVLAALISSAILGKARRRLHFRQVKVYVLMLGGIALYLFGEQGPGDVKVRSLQNEYWMFAATRLLIVGRSIFVKWKYMSFNRAFIPPDPPEDAMLFYNKRDPQKHRFKRFPEPVLQTLDVIFDSGLRDSDLHGMGPLGTQDLHMLTEGSYSLPVASVLSWLSERDTLQFGVLPPSMYESTGSSAESTFGTSSASIAVTIVAEKVQTGQVLGTLALVLGFCFGRVLCPWSTARSLFDRGSSTHSWKYNPIMIAMPCFLFDVLYINKLVSKFQILSVAVLVAIIGHYRYTLWNLCKRKQYLLLTQQLQYHHPSVVRTLQKKTLLEFLHNTSTDDYGHILLETAIRHGNNMREIARDTRVTVWDPSPSATAAWKLAFSLVTKSIRKQKQVRKLRQQAKEEVEQFVNNLIVDIAYRAVDLAEGHGGRMCLAEALAGVVAKRRAIRRLRKLAERRRGLRQKRRQGQLSAVPMQVATASGAIRSVHDFTTLSTSGRLPTIHSSPSADAVAQQHLSLTASQPDLAAVTSSMSGRGLSSALTSVTVPGLLLTDGSAQSGAEGEGSDDGMDSPKGARGDSYDGVPRGIWAHPVVEGRSPVGSVVLSFGDYKFGQLGVDPAEASKQGSRTSVIVVEELRGSEPVQVEAAGVASFVVTARGGIWVFGSNRAMELGMRKEVTQINSAQRMKSMRHRQIVQVAGSSSASGQAHTLALASNGEVYTFGTSTCGALGQGAEVKETPPLLLRMTKDVRISHIAAGARHTLLLSTSGHLYSIGDNSCGQLGTDALDFMKRPLQFADTPVPIGGALESHRVRRMAVGDDHSMVTTEDGRVFGWGANSNGQLGLGRLDNQAKPQLVRGLHHKVVTSLACGARHSVAIAGEGCEVWVFGSNAQGQLGLGQSSAEDGFQRTVPALCHSLCGRSDTKIVQVVAAASHTLVLTQVGEVYAFGNNAWGQLGFPPEGSKDASLLQASLRPAPAAFGARSSAYAFQQQARNRLASEADQPRAFAEGVARLYVPTRVVSLSLYQVRAIATADTHSLAIV